MSFLTNLWEKAMAKLGDLASFVPGIASMIHMAINEGDAAKVNAHAVQLKQFAQALMDFADAAVEATADGTLDLVEGSELALALEKVVDEADDVVKGQDD